MSKIILVLPIIHFSYKDNTEHPKNTSVRIFKKCFWIFGSVGEKFP